MDDSTFSNPYLTELRVMIRENAAVSEMYAKMLQAFVLDYNQRLENKMRGVETASEEAQKFWRPTRGSSRILKIFRGKSRSLTL